MTVLNDAKTVADYVNSMSYDDILTNLRARAIKGSKTICDDCPLANLLNALSKEMGFNHLEWEVGSTGFGLAVECWPPDEEIDYFSQSYDMNKFRHEFDQGRILEFSI